MFFDLPFWELTSPRNKNDSWIQLVPGIALRQLRWISVHSWKKTTASKNTHILYSVIRFWRSIKKRFITFQQELGSLREVWLEKGIDTMKGLIFLDGRCVVCTPGKTYIDNRCIHKYRSTCLHGYMQTSNIFFSFTVSYPSEYSIDYIHDILLLYVFVSAYNHVCRHSHV